MNTSIDLHTKSTAQNNNLPTAINNLSGAELTAHLPVKNSITRAALGLTAIVGFAFSTTNNVEAATVIIPDWANQTVLQGVGAIQSNMNSGGATRAGFEKIVTTEFTNASSVQVTWGVQARDLGAGLNVADWNPLIEVRSLQSGSSTVVATIHLDIHNFVNMDGTPIQMVTTGASTTFASPVNFNYGTSSTGRTNYVFAYSLTGDSLTTFQNSLLVGQKMAFFLINESNTNSGAAYTLGNATVLNNGGNPLATLNSVNLNTTSLPTEFNSTGIAFDLKGIPEPSIAFLTTVAISLLGLRRNRENN